MDLKENNEEKGTEKNPPKSSDHHDMLDELDSVSVDSIR